MEQKYTELKIRMQEITDLMKAAAVLRWDRQTRMPPGGVAARTRQTATLQRLIHERYTSDEMGELLETLDEWSQTQDADSDERGLVRLAQREYQRRRAVPASLVAEQAKASGAANTAWIKARAENDFASFIPHLEKMFALCRQYAACFPHVAHPYDALLDQFEPGMTTATISRVFNEVKGPQSQLLRAITESGVQVDDSLLHQHYPHDAQLAAALEAAQILGFDLQRGRLDLTTHPFASSFSVNDARITTRVDENFLNTCLFATLHETGHALYELGVAPRLEGLPLARGTSSGIHESQSRLFENLIGRSRPFSRHLFPILQQRFPAQLGSANLETYYRAINKVQPSLIRIEADEVSYNLHIILRFEIELGVLNGDIAIQDLPEAWNAKFQEYLGLTPPNNTLGVLQDIHWSWGLIGHFTSYALGNIISAQWWARMAADLPDRDAQMAQGNITPLREWLITHIHQHGRKFPANELIQRVTGSPIDTAPYLDYLHTKYRDIYQL